VLGCEGHAIRHFLDFLPWYLKKNVADIAAPWHTTIKKMINDGHTRLSTDLDGINKKIGKEPLAFFGRKFHKLHLGQAGVVLMGHASLDPVPTFVSKGVDSTIIIVASCSISISIFSCPSCLFVLPLLSTASHPATVICKL